VADKNQAPKHRSSSKQRYWMAVMPDVQRMKRKRKHQRRLAKQNAKHLKVPRGTARRLRRSDIVVFRAKQRQRAQAFTGTVKVNSPTLQMENRYIGQVPQGLQGLKQKIEAAL